MRIRTAFPALSVLIIVLAVALFGHGWGQALPFATGASHRDYLSAPIADEISLRPGIARLVAAQSSDDLAPDTPLLPASASGDWPSASATPLLAILKTPVRSLPYRDNSPRAPPIA